MDTIGTSLNSIFSRYESVREGKKFDPDNNPLNNVEKTLNRLGISIRSSSGQFKDFDVVLEDVSKKWNSWNTVEQAEVATSVAG